MTISHFSLILLVLCFCPLPSLAQGFYIGGLTADTSEVLQQNAVFSRSVPKNKQEWADKTQSVQQGHQKRDGIHQIDDASIKENDIILGQAKEKEQKRAEDFYFALLHQDPINLSPEPAPKLFNILGNTAVKESAFPNSVRELMTETSYERNVWASSGSKNAAEEQRPTVPFKMEGITLNGGRFDLTQYRGKMVLVDFFAPWCRPCIEDFARTKKLYNLYHKNGFEVISIGADSPAAIKELVRQQKLPWTVLSDEMTIRQRMPSIMMQHNIAALPTAYLIDAQGRMIDNNARGDRLKKILEVVFHKKETESLSIEQ